MTRPLPNPTVVTGNAPNESLDPWGVQQNFEALASALPAGPVADAGSIPVARTFPTLAVTRDVRIYGPLQLTGPIALPAGTGGTTNLHHALGLTGTQIIVGSLSAGASGTAMIQAAGADDTTVAFWNHDPVAAATLVFDFMIVEFR